MANPKTSGAIVRRDGQGEPTGATTWTGEVQAIAFTDTVGTTALTINGYDFIITATKACHINFGPQWVKPASATAEGCCYYIPADTPIQIYVPTPFAQDKLLATQGERDVQGTLYISIVRNTSTSGTLFIAEARPVAGTSRSTAVTFSSTSTTSITTT